MSQVLSVAVCQMTSVDDVSKNLEHIEKSIQSLTEPVDIVFFPENCLYFRIKEGEAIPRMELADPAFARLKKIAQEKKLHLHLGSVPLGDGDKLVNASVLIGPDGSIASTYQKVHLFDIELDGQKPIRESDVFSHGQKPAVLEIKDWKLGQTICYDLRFSELFSVYAKQAVDVILVPSAFLVKTGQAHWEVLLRARAIESQCYIVAAAQAGIHKNSQGLQRSTYGHSLIISPWGEILSQASADSPEILVAQFNKQQIEAVRRQIPMQGHRRL